MKIALVHTRLMRRGGLETRLFSYIDYFRKAGHKVTLVAYKIGDGVQIPEGVNFLMVEQKWIPKPIRPTFFERMSRKLLKQRSFDLILSLTRTTYQDMILAPANHWGFLQAKNKKVWSLYDRQILHLERKAFAAPGKILATSQMIADELAGYYRVPPAKMELLNPPIDHRRFHLELKDRKDDFRAKYGFASGKTSFVFISASHGRKGLPLLLKVFAELDPAKFELIVAGVKGVDTTLSHVKYIGFAKRPEELYAAADFMILPAVYEPFGQVVAESIFCGTPVLISEKVGAKEVVSEKEGLVVEGYEVGNWVSAIQNAKSHPFEIDSGFPERKKLRLEDHMQRIVDLAKVLRTGS